MAALVCSLHTTVSKTPLIYLGNKDRTIIEHLRGLHVGGPGRYYLWSMCIASTMSLPEKLIDHGQERPEEQFLW